MERAFTTIIFLSAMFSAMVALSLASPGTPPYLTPEGSAMAALSLFAALPLLDEGAFGPGKRVSAFHAGLVLAPPLYFFMRQQLAAQQTGNAALGKGADGILAVAFVLSLMARGIRLGVRWYRRDRSIRPR